MTGPKVGGVGKNCAVGERGEEGSKVDEEVFMYFHFSWEELNITERGLKVKTGKEGERRVK